jgi:hypothetical protein
MDKRVIDVIRKIISEPDRIVDVYRHDTEYYFRFKGKAMSLLYGPTRDAKFGPYTYYLYPRYKATYSMAAIAEESMSGGLEEPDMFSYSVADYPGIEDKALFEALYDILKRKHANIDGIFDELLGDF